MNFVERLYVGKDAVQVSDAIVELRWRQAGSAQFTTTKEPDIKKIVAYEVGFKNDLTRVFVGYIESYRQRADNQYRVFCRELAGRLREPLLISMQHPTLENLLEVVQQKTGLTFILPDSDYSIRKVPYTVNHGTGYNLLDSIGRTWNIRKYFYQQSGDGRIFVGSWLDCVWSKNPFSVPAKIFAQVGQHEAVLPVLPQLRPGAVINEQRIRTIKIEQHKMLVSWVS